MDRLIEIKVNGSHLTKDNLYAGVQGESNVTALRIEFDESWDGYAKTVVFWNARGENPVKRTLTADLLEDITQSSRIYLCMVPGEPLEEAGECTIVIDGYAEGKRPRSVPAKLKVRPAPDSDRAGEPVDPTPTQAEQLQAQIDNLLGDMQEQAVIAHDAATLAGEHAQAASVSEGNALQAVADAQAAKTAAESEANRAAAMAQVTEGYAGQAENKALSAAASAQEAEDGAVAAKKSEIAADAYATGAYQNAETATDRARDAQAAAERAERARDGVEQSERYSAQMAAAAAASAEEAKIAEEAASAAQRAAEEARDAADEIAGGDFASHTEVRTYAEAAETNAKAYTDQKIATLPTPDVSVQIGAHDRDTGSHEDIRSAAALAAAAAAEAAAAAATAQRKADGAASGSQAAQAVANSAHDVADAAKETAEAAHSAANAAVKKSGDTMTGGLGLTSLDFINDRMYGSISPEGASVKLQIIVGDKATGADCMFEIMPGGLRFTDTDYIERTVIHTGNLAQYMGVAQASLEK